MTSVRDAFTASFLLAEAGDGAFARGAVYEREARVGIVSDVDGRAEAIVHGTEPYAVALWIEHGRPGWFCACPAALDGSAVPARLWACSARMSTASPWPASSRRWTSSSMSCTTRQ